MYKSAVQTTVFVAVMTKLGLGKTERKKTDLWTRIC